MQIQIIAVGNKMPVWVDNASNDYLRRFSKDVSVSFKEITPSKRTKNTDISKVISDEGNRILNAIPNGNKVIALEVNGKQWSTPELSRQLSQWQMQGRNVSLLIGGPDGLSDACRTKAEQQWSLSKLTIPHPLVRVIVSEALYRAWSLMHNHPYHRE